MEPAAAFRRVPTYSAERWAQVRGPLEAAVGRDPAERGKFLTEACGSDQELFAEVEGLLRGLDQSPSFLQAPVVPAAANAEDPLLGTSAGPWRQLRGIGE